MIVSLHRRERWGRHQKIATELWSLNPQASLSLFAFPRLFPCVPLPAVRESRGSTIYATSLLEVAFLGFDNSSLGLKNVKINSFKDHLLGSFENAILSSRKHSGVSHDIYVGKLVQWWRFVITATVPDSSGFHYQRETGQISSMPSRLYVACLLIYFCPFIRTLSSTHSVYYNSMGFFLILIHTTLSPSQGHLHLWSLLREHHRPLGSRRGGYFAIIYLLFKVLLEESPRSSC